MASAAAEVTSASSATPAAATERTTFHVGTRRSQLALWQTDRAVELLRAAWPGHTFEIHPMATMGDKNQVTALHQFNAKSLWTHELEAQLTDGRLDLIVHSLKDVPTQLPAGCALSGGCDRTERRDCVVMGPAGLRAGHKTLSDLPAGSVVGTSSVRRIAQLAKIYPQLKIEDVRGNINTRLAKLDAEDSRYSALILAAAGVQRIDEGARITSFLSRREHGWYYPVGQGAIGLECRSDDKKVREMCMAIMENEKEAADGSSRGLRAWYEALAERMLLRTLEGGCSVPIGVDSVWESDDQLTLYGMVLSVDGKQCVEGKKTHKVRSREDAEAAGLDLAADLVERGAGRILEEIVINRQVLVDGGNA